MLMVQNTRKTQKTRRSDYQRIRKPDDKFRLSDFLIIRFFRHSEYSEFSEKSL
jgi:hypothetical protein